MRPSKKTQLELLETAVSRLAQADMDLFKARNHHFASVEMHTDLCVIASDLNRIREKIITMFGQAKIVK